MGSFHSHAQERGRPVIRVPLHQGEKQLAIPRPASIVNGREIVWNPLAINEFLFPLISSFMIIEEQP